MHAKPRLKAFAVGLLVSTLFLIGCDSPNKSPQNIKGNEDKFTAKPSPPVPSDISEKIENSIDAAVVKNVFNQILSSKMAKDYPLLASTFDRQVKILPKTKVWLYYEGLPNGGLWNKPGAAAFGGTKIGTIDFSNGAVPAILLAHKSLDENRNYFYVKLENGSQGWVGRPYVNKDNSSKEFYMPNPLTGEKIRKELKIEKQEVISELQQYPARYVPSYEEIDWIPGIPEEYRRQGYEMYKKSVSEGYDRVDAIVNQYLSEVE